MIVLPEIILSPVRPRIAIYDRVLEPVAAQIEIKE
jgi:hypothetical protein